MYEFAGDTERGKSQSSLNRQKVRKSSKLYIVIVVVCFGTGKLPIIEVSLYLLVHSYRRPAARQASHMVAAWPQNQNNLNECSPNQPEHRITPYSTDATTRSAGLQEYTAEVENRVHYIQKHLPDLLMELSKYHRNKLPRTLTDRLQFLMTGSKSERAATLREVLVDSQSCTEEDLADPIALASSIHQLLGPQEDLTNTFPTGPKQPMYAPVYQKIRVTGLSKTATVHACAKNESNKAKGVLPDIRIENCSDCQIYILRPVRYALIRGCHRCTIVASSVEKYATIETCDNSVITAACSRVRVVNCVEMCCYIYSKKQPVIAGDCRDITLAPYQITYPLLARDLYHASLISTEFPPETTKGWIYMSANAIHQPPNLWNEPVLIDVVNPRDVDSLHSEEKVQYDVSSKEHNSQSQIGLVPPEDFHFQSVPWFGVDDGANMLHDYPQRPVIEVPEAYKVSVSKKAEIAKEVHGDLQKASEELSEDAYAELQAAVQGHFREWLVNTGSVRSVSNLVRYHRKDNQGAGSPLKQLAFPHE